MENKKKTFYQKYGKRILDFTAAFLFLVLFWWIYVILSIIVRINMGSPIIYTQLRPGKNENIFELKKFRTMTNEKDENGKLLPNEKRITKFGKILRSTSFDELPEIINILKGDMSFVGPRPLLVDYLPYYTEKEKERHNIRPGLTGLAQINGRNNLSWENIFELDLEYVNNVTLFNDINIIIGTLVKVIKRSDVEIPKSGKTGRLDYERSLNKSLSQKK